MKKLWIWGSRLKLGDVGTVPKGTLSTAQEPGRSTATVGSALLGCSRNLEDPVVEELSKDFQGPCKGSAKDYPWVRPKT